MWKIRFEVTPSETVTSARGVRELLEDAWDVEPQYDQSRNLSHFNVRLRPISDLRAFTKEKLEEEGMGVKDRSPHDPDYDE